MFERADIAGGIILNPKNEVLLVYNVLTGNWSYPKGHVEGNEDLFSAAKREIEEETCLEDLALITELPKYERTTRQKRNKIKVMHLFLFQTNQTHVGSSTRDITKLKWVPLNQVPGHFTYKEDIDYFYQIRSKISSVK